MSPGFRRPPERDASVNPESSYREDWTVRLTAVGPERDVAIVELTRLLVRGLSRSLPHHYGGGLSVEDVAQEAILKILASLDQFAGRSRFTTWAMTIATRIGISELRHRYYRSVSLEAKMEENLRIDLPAPEPPSPGGDLDRHSLLAMLKRLIETVLTEKQKQATQGVLEGLPVEEIARRTGSNRNAVYKLVHDARMQLRDGFEAAGISASDVNAVLG